MATGKNGISYNSKAAGREGLQRKTDRCKATATCSVRGVNQLDLLVELVRVFISHSRTTFHRDMHQKTDLLLFLLSCVYILCLR